MALGSSEGPGGIPIALLARSSYERGPGERREDMYRDPGEQRQAARWAEQRLIEHTAHYHQPRPGSPDPDESHSLPPVFRVEGQWSNSRDTSIERRNARFRDTHLYGPPPPPPTSPNEIPRALRPMTFLVPQEVANQGITNDIRYAVPSAPMPPSLPPEYSLIGAPPPSRIPQAYDPQWSIDEPEERSPRYRMTPQGIAPTQPQPQPQPQPSPPQAPPFELLPPDVQQVLMTAHGQSYPPASLPSSQRLTYSQKKRLRRKKNKAASQPRPAPYPLEQDRQDRPYSPHSPTQSDQNGHSNLQVPAPPEPDPNISTRPACDHEVQVVLFANGIRTPYRFRCPLSPWPHPGQPHLLKLEASDPNTEVFIGWWGPGE